jgi:uncharacterized protein DUF4154
VAVLRALQRAALAAAVGGAALGGGATLADDPLEYAVKAALVYKVARFVEWPKGEACPSGSITVAVLGEDRFGAALDRALEGRRLGDRPVRVQRLARAEDVPVCTVLWLGADQAERLPALAERLRSRFVVMVGDAAGFARRGGMIGLPVENERVVIEVNPEAAAAGGVTISSRLVGVARLVRARAATKAGP